MKRCLILISEDHKKYIEDEAINLSKFVRNAIEERKNGSKDR